ncbi:MAG: DUF378 domain-containing protein [Candidatus Zambryskibacteria bacterium]|nr:DUF378 domain-containing protein [Candidatus Zambryskibacteria bacterium]
MHKVTFILVIIGALNWGLEVLGYGIGNYLPETAATVVYTLVGLSAVYEIFSHKGLCQRCMGK